MDPRRLDLFPTGPEREPGDQAPEPVTGDKTKTDPPHRAGEDGDAGKTGPTLDYSGPADVEITYGGGEGNALNFGGGAPAGPSVDTDDTAGEDDLWPSYEEDSRGTDPIVQTDGVVELPVPPGADWVETEFGLPQPPPPEAEEVDPDMDGGG